MRDYRMTRPRGTACPILTTLLCLSWPLSVSGATSAEQLASRVPEDTLAFIATSGIDELKPAFEKTVLHQFLNDPNVRSVIDKAKALIQTKIEADANDPAAKALLEFAKTVYRRPILAGISSAKGEKTSSVYGFLIIDAGPQKDAIDSALRKVEPGGPSSFGEMKVDDLAVRVPTDCYGPPPVYWGWVDRIVVIGFDDTQCLVIKGLKAGRSTPLPASLARLPSRGDALVLYADLKRLHGLIMSTLKEFDDEEELKVVTTFSNKLALEDLQTLAVRAGFQDKGPVVDGSLQIANPKGPVVGLLRPADLSLFDAADANTITATVWNVDLAGLYDLVMQTAKAVMPPEDYADLEKEVAEVEAGLGFKIRQDLLAGLAGPMSLLAVEVPNSIPPTGLILMAKLSRPDAMDKTLASLAKIVADESNKSIQVGTMVQDGYTVRCISGTPLAMVQLMPTWVVAKDRLILASNNTLCSQALRQFVSGSSPKNPLRSTASYRQVCARLPEALVSLQYADTPRQFKQVLRAMQPYWPLATMAVAHLGIQLPVALPSFDRIVEQMPPSVFYCWQEKDGLRWHSTGSSMDAAAVTGVAVGAAIAVPALARTRTQAMRVASMNNLKRIGLGCIMYADSHSGLLPPSLQSLVDGGLIQAKALQSPRTSSAEGKPFYLYLSGQTTKMDPQNIVAYEDPDQVVEGINAVFLEGHVEFLRHEAFKKRLEETHKRLGREMPK